jgi:site-specific DNA recombinase
MKQKYRCAIYTRKSTQDGLDQEFNSLDAQREACEAYITSQKHEGWRPLKEHYDDGGISGGTMVRSALQKLLNEVKAGRVDIIVVYKVDRLTRALSDFAKMVELFDEHHVSFVSVTQNFNTTSSMGRLTLNVLLSFAQFEREVTAERIRDKIAASKKKGMWMGGLVPLGYDSVDKKLVVNEEEAETVRKLFELYLQLGNVRMVKAEADKLGLITKIRVLKDGRRCGGGPFARGHLYRIYSNRIYIGEVVHKGQFYEGQHQAVVEREIWEQVQTRLKRNASDRKFAINAKSGSLLAGLIVDQRGNRLTPSHACKGDRRYRYYVSAVANKGGEGTWRLPANEIEGTVVEGITSFLNDQPRLLNELVSRNTGLDHLECILQKARQLVSRIGKATRASRRALLLRLIAIIEINANRLRIKVRKKGLCDLLDLEELPDSETGTIELDLPMMQRKRGVEKKLILLGPQQQHPRPDANLIKAVAQGRCWFDKIRHGEVGSAREIAETENVDSGDMTRALPLAFLAPDIVEAILDGRQPAYLTSFKLKRVKNLPSSWSEQRRLLGFAD